MAPRSKRSLAVTLNVSTKRTRTRSTRSSVRKQEASKPTHDNPTNFKAIWRALRTEGWYSQPPPRSFHDSFYSYIRGGSSLKGQEGTDICCW
ncbi:hypothetical protein JG687_00004082 [Phytophthora cactorum]|uniref:Uncharacterized protein n=1 Tax=Phytophthora cactorum TaxID=29920 RepID=A0A8T1UQY3_9STRA|nr:hypothetical protein JG687_00004082 [Phytophthora cactorum]